MASNYKTFLDITSCFGAHVFSYDVNKGHTVSRIKLAIVFLYFIMDTLMAGYFCNYFVNKSHPFWIRVISIPYIMSFTYTFTMKLFMLRYRFKFAELFDNTLFFESNFTLYFGLKIFSMLPYPVIYVTIFVMCMPSFPLAVSQVFYSIIPALFELECVFLLKSLSYGYEILIKETLDDIPKTVAQTIEVGRKWLKLNQQIAQFNKVSGLILFLFD